MQINQKANLLARIGDSIKQHLSSYTLQLFAHSRNKAVSVQYIIAIPPII